MASFPVPSPRSSGIVELVADMEALQTAVAEKDHELDTLRNALDEKRVCRPLPPPPPYHQQPPPHQHPRPEFCSTQHPLGGGGG